MTPIQSINHDKDSFNTLCDFLGDNLIRIRSNAIEIYIGKTSKADTNLVYMNVYFNNSKINTYFHFRREDEHIDTECRNIYYKQFDDIDEFYKDIKKQIQNYL